MSDLRFIHCDWQQYREQLSFVRREVFIQEQNVPEELEWDEFDRTAQHILVLNDTQPVATARIKKDGHIGRMAVLKQYRQQGIGSEILLRLLDDARKLELKKVFLYAQVSAIHFYEKQGFVCEGNEFMDAGIPHKMMIKKL